MLEPRRRFVAVEGGHHGVLCAGNADAAGCHEEDGDGVFGEEFTAGGIGGSVVGWGVGVLVWEACLRRDGDLHMVEGWEEIGEWVGVGSREWRAVLETGCVC